MSKSHIDDLIDHLSIKICGHHYTKDSSHDDKLKLDQMHKMICDWELGDISYAALVNSWFKLRFDKHMDIKLWALDRVAEGIYDETWLNNQIMTFGKDALALEGSDDEMSIPVSLEKLANKARIQNK